MGDKIRLLDNYITYKKDEGGIMRHLRGDVGTQVKENIVSIREKQDLIVSRLGMLCGADRDIMSLFFESGASKRQIAAIAGVHEATIGRKINKLASAITDGVYIKCLRNGQFFTKEQLEVARLYFVGGFKSGKIGSMVGMRSDEVRGIIAYVKLVTGNFRPTETVRKCECA